VFFLNVAASAANSVQLSSYYWMTSGVLGGVIICIEVHQRRWSFILALTAVLLAVHPTWTVAALPGPDCVFPNVLASQFVLAVICAMLAYQVVRIARSRKSRA
jgi:hypothetical protein